MLQASIKGPWAMAEIEQFLTATRYPLRLSCVGADGFPRVVSVWFRFDGRSLLCVSHRDSNLVALLRGNPRVGFELATNDPPYYGIRGQGLATLSDAGAEDTLRELLQRYLGGTSSQLARWLLSRGAEELLIAVEPRRLFSWDYRERMQDVPARQ